MSLALLLPTLLQSLQHPHLRQFSNETFNTTNHSAIDYFPNDTFSSGYIEVDDYDSLFYLLFDSRRDPSSDPLVIWLQGGPGCSSELALFTEIGPYNLRYNASAEHKLHLEYNNYSWNQEANLLFLDQPVGTGLSFAYDWWSYRWNEQQIAEDFYNFLLNFVEERPEFKGRDIYITGESYAGHYIPRIAAFVQEQANPDLKIKGLAIGNGWVDPFYQYPAYNKFAYEKEMISEGTSFVLDLGYQVCQYALLLDIPVISAAVCALVEMPILGNPFLPNFNYYDVRLPCENAAGCYPDNHISSIINTLEFRDYINQTIYQGWQECAFLPHLFLTFDQNQMYGHFLGKLLDEGEVDVLIYSGDQDYICNWRGGEAWTQALLWKHQQEFNLEEYKYWPDAHRPNDDSKLVGKAGGMFKHFDKLTFMRLYDAGHMVPMDQPERAFKMIKEFIDHGKLKSF